MKKITLIFSIVALCVLLCLGLVSCGGNGGTETGGIEDSVTDSTENSELTTDSDIEQGGGLVPDPEPETEKEYVTITFDTQGGSAIESIQVEKGGKISKPSDPEKLGYELEGWYVSGEKWSFVGYIAAEDMTLTANWNIVEYTIEYVCEGTHSNKASYTIEDEFELSGVILDDYDFLGWYEDQEYTKPITKIERGTTGNLKLYAKISPTPLIFSEVEGGYSVTDCDVNATSVVILSAHNGKPVISIGNSAFKDCTSLTSVEIPSSVTTIGTSAFEGCTSLESITVDKNNQNYCSIDGNLYSKDQKTLIQYAIGKPDSSFVVPDSVTTIGESAFEDCTSLESIEIPSGVTTICDYAFFCCDSLESIKIPSSLTTIGKAAFYSCTSLESVEIPSSVTSIGEAAFSNCASLTSIEIPSSVITIGDLAFYNCTNLESIVIPSNVTTIGKATFYSCTSLASIKIPSSVTSIGDNAFYNCTSLSSVTIPSSVTTIGDYVFRDCTSLESVEIPSGVTTIGECMFYNCASLASIEIPSSVTSIGDNAFRDCTSLASVEIPSSVTSIGVDAFCNCTSLTSVELGSGVTTIGDRAFEDCTSLESIVIPSSVTTIGYFAFYDCTSLTIYAQAENQPSGWDSDWNYSDCPVVWNYKEN